jgi:hypothetical protein
MENETRSGTRTGCRNPIPIGKTKSQNSIQIPDTGFRSLVPKPDPDTGTRYTENRIHKPEPGTLSGKLQHKNNLRRPAVLLLPLRRRVSAQALAASAILLRLAFFFSATITFFASVAAAHHVTLLRLLLKALGLALLLLLQQLVFFFCFVVWRLLKKKVFAAADPHAWRREPVDLNLDALLALAPHVHVPDQLDVRRAQLHARHEAVVDVITKLCEALEKKIKIGKKSNFKIIKLLGIY